MKLSEYKTQLLEKVSKSQLLKENLTISEMESFKGFVKNLTKEQAMCIIKKCEEEEPEKEVEEDISPIFKQAQQKWLAQKAAKPIIPPGGRWASYTSKSKTLPNPPPPRVPPLKD